MITATTSTSAAPRKPNVILIMSDDQGYADMGCHGNPFIRTPNIDRLHDESVSLEDFHVDPTCSPTRAALMTGRYAARTGVWLTYAGRNYPRRDEVMVGKVFHDNGYRTGVFGKWHLGDDYPFRPMDRGFEESLIHGGGVVGETPDYWDNDYYDDTYVRNGKRVQVTGYCTDVWFSEAIKFLDRKDDRPAFIYIATNAPHGPLHVPIEYVQPYLDAGVPDSRARYYGMIASIDENLGRLRRHLEETGQAENTVIIFLNDNGTTLGAAINKNDPSEPEPSLEKGWNAGMRGRKGSAYEGGHRAACFVSWPKGGLNVGHNVPQLASHIDILPTLIDLCGLRAPEGVQFDGRSLVPLLRGNTAGWPDRTLVVHDQGRFGQPVGDGLMIKGKDFSVMRGPWRLVGKQLFNLRTDPGQRHDVASWYPELAAELAAEYEAWWQSVSEGAEAHNPVVIDSSKQKTTLLTAQGWSGDTVPYNQQHVRTDMGGNGYWVIETPRAGTYAFELRRWPRELNLPFSAVIPLPERVPARHQMRGVYKQPTAKIDARQARIVVGDVEREASIGPSDTAVRFEIPLEPGEHRVQTWITDAAGETRGAYYVYVESVSINPSNQENNP